VRNEEETDLRLRHLRWHRDDLKCRPDEPNCRHSLVWLTRESRIPLQDSLQPVRALSYFAGTVFLAITLPIVGRGQSTDSALAQSACVPLAAPRSLQNSPGNDFAIHFQLADILERVTCQVVRQVHGGYLLWIKMDQRIDPAKAD
jgi:hypothetical protein